MSKRYGRTKKKQHLQKIADLQASERYNKDTIDRLKQATVEWFDFVKEFSRYWDNCVLMDVKTDVAEQLPDQWRMYCYEPDRLANYNMMEPVAEVEVKECVLEMIRIHSEIDPISLARHIRLYISDKAVQYAISERYFDLMPYPPSDKVYGEILKQMLNQIMRDKYDSKRTTRR